MRSAKDRIIEHIENQGITKSEFCQNAGLSNGYLTQKGAVSTSNLEKIVKAYPDIDLHYIVAGEHILKTNEDQDLNQLLTELNDKMDTVIARQSTVNSFIDMLKGLTDLERFRELLTEHKPIETNEHSN